MTAAESSVLIARLFGFFPPKANGGEEQAWLYAEKLERYPVDVGARAIDKIVETRVDPFPPAWAELAQWLDGELPRLAEIEQADGVPCPPEVLEAWRNLKQRQAARDE